MSYWSPDWTGNALQDLDILLIILLLRYVLSSFDPVSIAWLTFYNHGLLKLSNGRGGCRGWAKEVMGVSLVEVSWSSSPHHISC